jgi:hypothetical protein
MSKPTFNDNNEQRPILSDENLITVEDKRSLSEEELHDACLHCAATIIVAVELGCEFEDCRLTDDGSKWPTFLSSVEIKYPESWDKRGAEVFPAIASIHEAGCQAVAKRHGRGPHRINNYTAVRTSDLLDEPRIWKAIEALAQLIESEGGYEGCYGAMGTDAFEVGDDSAALKLIRDMGL